MEYKLRHEINVDIFWLKYVCAYFIKGINWWKNGEKYKENYIINSVKRIFEFEFYLLIKAEKYMSSLLVVWVTYWIDKWFTVFCHSDFEQ